MTQEKTLDILKIGKNVFLTGEAGSGKTYVLNEYIKWLKSHDIEPAVTASTGIAATHLGGVTLHSWAGLGVKESLSKFDLDKMEGNKTLWRKINSKSVLIIDEVSMLSGNLLDMTDKVLRHIRRSDEPFGGMQIICSGDFFQLPPIAREESFNYAFESKSWREMNPVICYLNEQYRQGEDVFIEMLSAIRENRVSRQLKELLKERINENLPEDGERSDILRLFTHNLDVDSMNEEYLNALEGEERGYEMVRKGRKQHIEALIRGCLAPEKLVLKKGAKVIFVKNDTKGQYVNGTQGEIVGFSGSGPVVKTLDGRKIFTEPVTWRREEEGRVFAEISQVPLRLAWAITVHKSQGMTLDKVEVDLSKSFVSGQGYVALSRVRSIQGLYLSGLNEKALSVDSRVSDADKTFKRKSFLAEKRLKELSLGDLAARQEDFITSCGGSVIPTKKAEKKKIEREISTYEKTKELLNQGFSLEEVAEKRSLSLGTIISHTEKLLKDGEKLELDLSFLNKKDIDDVKKAVGESNFEKLSPVRDKLKKKGKLLSYDELRRIRLYLWSLN